VDIADELERRLLAEENEAYAFPNRPAQKSSTSILVAAPGTIACQKCGCRDNSVKKGCGCRCHEGAADTGR
jgi:hypothetical protein